MKSISVSAALLCLEQWDVQDLEQVADFQQWQKTRFERQAAELLAQAGVAAAYVYLIQFTNRLAVAGILPAFIWEQQLT